MLIVCTRDICVTFPNHSLLLKSIPLTQLKLNISVSRYISVKYVHTEVQMRLICRDKTDTLMRRGFTVTTAGVVTWRLPRLDGLYRRAGQLVRAVCVL